MNATQERARQVLGKGVRKKRIRRLSVWSIKNRFLTGLVWAEDMTVADFAAKIGASTRAVNAWMYEGVMPGKDRRRKAAEILRCPEYILWMEPYADYLKRGKKIPE